MSEHRLHIPEAVIRASGPAAGLGVVGVFVRQWRAERALARRGVLFRGTDAAGVLDAYARMSGDEFDAVNARGDWANWRVIPRALSDAVPDRPLTVLDLGCGTGASTLALAFYCPPGSTVVGYEPAAPIVEVARRRTYRHRDGSPAHVEFVCQGACETFRRPDGSPVPDGGADVVTASGFVGHHLTPETVKPLVAETARVTAPGGVAALDVGPTLSEEALTRVMAAAGFTRLRRVRSCFVDRNGQVVYRKGG